MWDSGGAPGGAVLGLERLAAVAHPLQCLDLVHPVGGPVHVDPAHWEIAQEPPLALYKLRSASMIPRLTKPVDCTASVFSSEQAMPKANSKSCLPKTLLSSTRWSLLNLTARRTGQILP